MKKIFKKAHKMTREMVNEYRVDYQAQFGLCLSYLFEEEKEEGEMIKNYVEEKGLVIKVVDNNLKYYKEGKLVAVTKNFDNKNNTKDFGDDIGVRFHMHKGMLENYSNMRMKKETFKQLINIKLGIKKAIDKYFKELDNVKLGELSNYSYYFKEDNEELESLNTDYYNETKRKWLENNKKYIVKIKDEWEKNEMGQMENIREYEFKKENIEAIDKKIKERESNKSEARKESEIRYAKLYDLAEELSDEDFEDITGLKREDYLI